MFSVLGVEWVRPQVIEALSVSLYGDGHAGEFIVQTLLNIFVEEG